MEFIECSMHDGKTNRDKKTILHIFKNEIMRPFETITCENADYVSTLWLSRPEVRNAINSQMALELIDFFTHAANDPTIRMVVLKGKGKYFCAGGDLNWMLQGEAIPTHQQPGMILSKLFRTIYEFPKPVIAFVEGAAMGGALGLIAACDFVVAAENVSFCFSEVKLGLAPATISPFVVKRIGEFRSRQLMVSAKVFSASEAVSVGMAEFAGTRTEMEAYVLNLAQHITAHAPEAVKTTKRLIRHVADKPIDDDLSTYTADLLQQLQGSDEAKEGIKAFLEKRMAVWPPSNENKIT